VELYSRLINWTTAGFGYSHADVFVGMRFPVLFEQAGFSDVETLGLQAYWLREVHRKWHTWSVSHSQ
jgi:hypothetical protein